MTIFQKIILVLTLEFTLNISFLNSQESAETFLVHIFDDSYKVVGPKKFFPNFGVILDNKTLATVRGVLQTQYRVIQYVAIKPQKTITVNVEIKNNEKLIFLPQAPAFQEVQLIFGQEAYEIPPKK
jgi:hypothetical protein